MLYTRKLITAPSAEPVSAATIKAQTRYPLDETSEDTLIAAYIAAAREYLEQLTNRAFIAQTWDVYAHRFPCGPLELPFGQLTAVGAFEWTDVAGTVQSWTVSGTELTASSVTMATIDTIAEPARIVLAYGQSWPTDSLATNNPIRIRLTAGWANAAAMPESLKHAVTLLAGHWFENRIPVALGNPAAIQAKELPFAVTALIASWRLP